jgi:hypothetical protein
MKIISKIGLNVAAVNLLSLITSVAFAVSPETPAQNVDVAFYVHSMDKGNEQIINFFTLKENVKYCQDVRNEDFGTEIEGTSITFSAPAQGHTLSLPEGTVFCIELKDNEAASGWAVYNTRYFGPFVATAECTEDFVTMEEAYLVTPSNKCLPTSYAPIKIKNEAFSDKDKLYAGLVNYEQNNSILCNSGEKLIQSTIDFMHSEPVDSLAGINVADTFCASYKGSDDGISFLTYFKEGPFTPKTEAGACNLVFKSRDHVDSPYQVLLADENCTSKDMFVFKNNKYATGHETATKVEILNAASSNTCQKGDDRGDTLGGFTFMPEQIQNINIHHITDANDKFCLVVSEGNDELKRYGPYTAKPGCEISIEGIDGENVASDLIDGTYVCDGPTQ